MAGGRQPIPQPNLSEPADPVHVNTCAYYDESISGIYHFKAPQRPQSHPADSAVSRMMTLDIGGNVVGAIGQLRESWAQE